MSKSAKRSDILFSVYLDEEKLPEKIEWKATDSTAEKPQECKAVLVSIWDAHYEEALRIDLWTKEMRQDEMNKFFFQTLILMAETYQKANKNAEMAQKMKNFAIAFGEETKVIQKKNSNQHK
ncbi:MAG: gliding motility protein GldC [Chitinophagales bacterium]